MSEWRAAVIESSDAFMRGEVEIVIWRRLGERVEYITNLAHNSVITATMGEHEADHDDGRLRIPREALTALVEAVKPGPATGELARLEEALSIERRRVDDVLLDIRSRP